MPRAFVIWRDAVRTGLWTIPIAMMLFGVLLYVVALRVDQVLVDEQALRTWWLHGGTGDDARNLLSTLVTAIITMSSVVFSITIVPLSLAASQFGSRLVRTYMADRRTKGALGLFAMTTIYCLLALRAVSTDMPASDVPHVTVTIAVVLGMTCVLALLFFLHAVARSIVADEVIRRVSSELREAIEAMPGLAERQDAAAAPGLAADFAERSVRLVSRLEGYIELIDYERLVAVAAEHGLVVRLERRAGAYVAEQGWLGSAYPAHAVTPEVMNAVQATMVIGPRRTPTQDLEFQLRHVVDIALRALSPGINDANTALVVVDHLAGALSRLMGKRLPDTLHCDATGTLRVVRDANSHAGILDAALHQLRQAAAAQPAVIINMLGALGRVAEHARLADQYDALVRHTQLVAAAGLRCIEEPADGADIEAAKAATLAKLGRLRSEATSPST